MSVTFAPMSSQDKRPDDPNAGIPRAEVRLRKLIGPPETINLWRAMRAIVLVVTVVILVAATAERLVEPKVFTSFGRALWWAVVTVATVGYGDIVPESPWGRFVAGVMIITAMALIPLTTSVIVSALVARAQAHQRDEINDRLEVVAARLDQLDRRLEQLMGETGSSAKPEPRSSADP